MVSLYENQQYYQNDRFYVIAATSKLTMNLAYKLMERQWGKKWLPNMKTYLCATLKNIYIALVNLVKDVQCYELFGGIALKNHAFSFFFYTYFI